MQIKKLSAAIVFVLLLTLGTTAFAQTSTIYFGQTTVRLSTDFVAALGTLNVSPGTIFPTRLESGVVNFPVTSGAIDLQNAKGEILHSGGLRLSTATTKVRLQAFTIDTTNGQPFISGLVVVNNRLLGRLPLFTLQLPSGFSLPLKPSYGWINLKGVGVRLSSPAATALNTVFGVSAFQAGFNIGTANVSMYAR